MLDIALKHLKIEASYEIIVQSTALQNIFTNLFFEYFPIDILKYLHNLLNILAYKSELMLKINALQQNNNILIFYIFYFL